MQVFESVQFGIPYNHLYRKETTNTGKGHSLWYFQERPEFLQSHQAKLSNRIYYHCAIQPYGQNVRTQALWKEIFMMQSKT